MRNENIMTYNSQRLKEEYYCVTHKSGLKVYVFPKDRSSSYAVIETRFGRGDEEFIDKDGKKITLPFGTAHFLEHRMFGNREGREADEVFASLGAECNAFTTHVKTAYDFSSSENIYECLEELLTFVFDPYFDGESIEREKGIITEEIREYSDNPYSVSYNRLLSGMYKEIPVKYEIGGTEKSISEITPDILYLAHSAFYVPENMSLSVCGKFEADRVVELVDKVFENKHFNGFSAKKIVRSEIPSVVTDYTECRMNVSRPVFYLGVKDTDIPETPKERLKKDAVMSVLLQVLFSMSGSFASGLYKEGIISSDLYSSYGICETFAYVEITCDTDDPVKLCDIIKKHIAEVAISGIDERSFERGKRVHYSDYVRDFDSTDNVANMILDFHDDGLTPFDYLKEIEGMTVCDCNEVLRGVFKPDRYTLSVVYPNDNTK